MKLILIRFPFPPSESVSDANAWCQSIRDLFEGEHKVAWIFQDINQVEFEVIDL